jgi:pimeloyl-ACP methyl ester carboxylesterase
MHHSVRTVNIGGLSIAFRDSEGPGPAVAFLHGTGFSMDAFGRQFDSGMLRDYRLVALDLPGHGASADVAKSDEVYSLKGYAAVTRAFLESIGIRRAMIVGWSLGGHIAMELLATSDIAAGLMITGAPPIALGPFGLLRGFCTSWDLLLASKERFTERDEQRFLALCLGADSGEPAFARALHRADGRVRSAFVRSILRGDGADEAWAVKSSVVPIAVVNGVDEPFARLSYVAGLSYGNLWRDRCHVIDDAGHAPFWQKPIIYNALLRDFVDEAADYAAPAREVRYRSA